MAIDSLKSKLTLARLLPVKIHFYAASCFLAAVGEERLLVKLEDCTANLKKFSIDLQGEERYEVIISLCFRDLISSCWYNPQPMRNDHSIAGTTILQTTLEDADSTQFLLMVRQIPAVVKVVVGLQAYASVDKMEFSLNPLRAIHTWIRRIRRIHLHKKGGFPYVKYGNNWHVKG